MNKYILGLCLLMWCGELKAQKIHAHNDYLNPKPFYGAFEARANSIEVDVFLVNGKLMVAHTEAEIQAKNTLESLYLKPLENMYKKTKQLQILIDIKTEPMATLDAVIKTLKKYPNLIKSEVRIVISGKRPPKSQYGSYPDFIYFDHQSLDDLSNQKDPKIALLNFSFKEFSDWDGLSPLPIETETLLKAQIKATHDSGYPIRFWGCTDTPLVWQTFTSLGIDYINTDQVQKCRAFLKNKKKP